MSKLVLITGGAGFIGSHLADELLRHGYRVRAFDNLDPQVHGSERRRPSYLDPDAELIIGDVRDQDAIENALDGVDVVYHFAAAVGVGQSMYQIAHYISVNDIGTAVLLEVLMRRPVEKLVVASSMSLYGEGLYCGPDGSVVAGAHRSLDQLKKSDWEVRGTGGEVLTPVPTPETKQPEISSVYALSKYDQERMCLMSGSAYNIPTVALRFFNVFGTRQSLSNPYTGVIAIFASRFLNGNPPVIFEDGLQKRDLVSVYDIAHACRLAIETPEAAGNVINIGGGKAYTVLEIADRIANALNVRYIQPEIVGKYRVGDIRNCFADISRARRILGYEPRVTVDTGIVELAEWLQGQNAVDKVDDARAELTQRGLTV